MCSTGMPRSSSSSTHSLSQPVLFTGAAAQPTLEHICPGGHPRTAVRWCDAARCEQGAEIKQRGARLVGAIGACTHRPPVRSLTTVMRTVVDTLMPASDCGAERIRLEMFVARRVRACYIAAQCGSACGVRSTQIFFCVGPATDIHADDECVLAYFKLGAARAAARSLPSTPARMISQPPPKAPVRGRSAEGRNLLLLKRPDGARHDLRTQGCVGALAAARCAHLQALCAAGAGSRAGRAGGPRSARSAERRAAREGRGSLRRGRRWSAPRRL